MMKLALASLVIASMLRGDEPRFLIDAMTVQGLHFASSRIVVAESRLEPGRAYSERELRDMLARIQRLPFVVHADLALRRGSQRDHYILDVTIEEMKPLFIDYGLLYESIGDWTPGVFTNSDVYRHTEEYPNIGARLFPGSRSMLLLTAETHGDNNLVVEPIYGISWTQYDLFGTRASATASVRYRENSFDLKGLPFVEGRTGLTFNEHLLLDVSTAIPLAGNQAIRAEWHRVNAFTSVDRGENLRLKTVHFDHPELLWIYNSTNDLLFPTAGTYGELRAEAQSQYRHVAIPGTENSGIDYSWSHDFGVQATHFFPLTPEQSLMARVDATHFHAIDEVHLRGGYTATRPVASGPLGRSDLHFECALDRDLQRSKNELTAGVALRNGWGIVHLDFRYLNWRIHAP